MLRVSPAAFIAQYLANSFVFIIHFNPTPGLFHTMMEIIIPYNLQFAGVVASFAEETGSCYGANDMEKQRLRLLAEEAFTLIVTGIPDREFSELFHLKIADTDNGLQLQFSNHGRPMDVRAIPEFNTENPEATLDGLSLDLLRNFCDELNFRNLGKHGWELQIVVKLVCDRKTIHAADIPAIKNTQALADMVFRRSLPQDAPDIINLVYNTYRYSYVKSLFYDKTRLTQAIADGELISAVAVTANGRVIGHNGVIIESPLLGEVGMAMIEPDFRKGNIFMSLAQVTLNDVIANYPDLMGYAKTVTSHKASQAFTTSFTPCLLQLSVYPHASFIGISGTTNPRESLVFFVLKLTPSTREAPVFIPPEHQEIIKNLFSELDITATLLPYDGRLSDDESRSEVKADIEKQHAVIGLRHAGADLAKHLRQQTRLLQQEGIMTVDIQMDASINQDAGLDALLCGNGYFFCGMKPEPDGSWTLVYSNLLNQKFQFENLQIFSPGTRKFCNYVQVQYQKTL